MKKVFSALGKAILYFLAYLGVQFIGGMVVGAVLSPQCISPSGELDMVKYQELVSESTTSLLIVSGAVTLIIYLIVTLIGKKNMLQEISLNKMKPLGIIPIFMIGISLNFLLMLLISCLPFSEAMQESYTNNSGLITGSVGITAWLSTVIITPIVEEVVFRGFIYSRLKNGTGIIAAAILTSLSFGAVHGTIIWAVYTFIFSLVLIFVFERFHSLWACIVLHMAFNFIGMAMSTWASAFESLNYTVVYIVSAVVFVLGAVWCLKLTKKEKACLCKAEPVGC